MISISDEPFIGQLIVVEIYFLWLSMFEIKSKKLICTLNRFGDKERERALVSEQMPKGGRF